MASATNTLGTKTFETLQFDNRVLRSLPVDSITENYVRTTPNSLFSRVTPAPVSNPRLVVASPDALALLDLDVSELSRPDAAAFLCGNRIPPGAMPAAHCYAGHQFGVFAGQLGDGAAAYLGEVVNSRGERWELQLKGSGLTPFSRTADGRKVLRSSIREFLASEAMAALNIPTTRAGSVVMSDDRVTRDIFYTGEPIQEHIAVITRIAPTFLRFGSLEVFKLRDSLTGRWGPSMGNTELLERTLRFICETYYPQCANEASSAGQTTTTRSTASSFTSTSTASETPEGGVLATADAVTQGKAYIAMFREICRRTAKLVAAWQGVGFCHGVLNTDNMSIVGLTLDYGPYGWMDRMESGHVPNTSDTNGRYSYDSQPAVCRWNLLKLGEMLSLAPSVQAAASAMNATNAQRLAASGTEESEQTDGPDGKESTPASTNTASNANKWDFRSVVDETYSPAFRSAFYGTMRRKLGFGFSLPNHGEGTVPDCDHPKGNSSDDDIRLVMRLLDVMEATGADFTNTFRALMRVDPWGAELGPASSSPSQSPTGTAPTNDPVVIDLLSHCSSASELAEATRPIAPIEQLEALAALAARDPNLANALGGGLEGQLERLQRYRTYAAMNDDTKRADDTEKWTNWLMDYRTRLRTEAETCDSTSIQGSNAPSGSDSRATNESDVEARRTQYRDARKHLMSHSNPKYVLRNWIAQTAIEAAEAGNFSEVQRVAKRLRDPFGLTDDNDTVDVRYTQRPSAQYVYHEREIRIRLLRLKKWIIII